MLFILITYPFSLQYLIPTKLFYFERQARVKAELNSYNLLSKYDLRQREEVIHPSITVCHLLLPI